MPKNEGSVKSARKYDLDFLRVIAIAAVVLIHCIATVQFKPLDSVAWNATNLIDSFIHWCVPVFIMISGALLINDRAYENTGQFFKKRFSRIAIPLLVWPVLYYAFQLVVYSAHYSPMKFVKSFLAGAPLYGNHLYFLFLIAGLYALTPMLSAYVSRVPRRHVWVVAIALCVAAAVWDALVDLKLMSQSLNMFTRGLPYVGYFLLGYLLKDTILKSKKHIRLNMLIFIGSSLLVAASAYILAHRFGIQKSVRMYNYTYIFVIISSISFFLAGRTLYEVIHRRLSGHTAKLQRVLKDLSAKSFGVYLIHLMIFNYIVHTWLLDRRSLKQMLIVFPLVLLLSWTAVTLLRRIPKANYLLG